MPHGGPMRLGEKMGAVFDDGGCGPRFAPRGWANRVDWSLAVSALAAVAIGAVYVAGSAPDSRGPGLAVRQLLYAAVGLAAMVGLMRLDYKRLLGAAPFLYLATLLLLCGVLFTRPINGARSWYDLKIVRFQPSEIAKIVTVLTLAYYIMYRDNYKRLSGLAVPLAIAAVPMALILRQPDLGTTMVFVPMFGAMLFVAGARLRHLAVIGVAGAAGLAAMWFTVMKDYQKRRVLAWLVPEQYRSAEAWQLMQSQAAISSGGWWGTGWGGGDLNRLHMLPERHTDFIFSVIATEGGAVTALALLGCFLIMGMAGLGIALRIREPAGRLIAVGLTVQICSQAAINVGVTLGMLPTTGLTLPLVSYGGSSMIATFASLGILMGIAARQEPVLAREDFA